MQLPVVGVGQTPGLCSYLLVEEHVGGDVPDTRELLEGILIGCNVDGGKCTADQGRGYEGCTRYTNALERDAAVTRTVQHWNKMAREPARRRPW